MRLTISAALAAQRIPKLKDAPMRVLGFIAAMTAIAVAGPAYGQDFCRALKRIQTASHAPLMFASLEDGSELIPGYPVCRAIKGEDGFINCGTGHFAPVEFELAAIAKRVSDCLGVEPALVRRGAQEGHASGRSFIVGSHCDERCKVGRSAYIIGRRMPVPVDR